MAKLVVNDWTDEVYTFTNAIALGDVDYVEKRNFENSEGVNLSVPSLIRGILFKSHNFALAVVRRI